VHKIHVCRIVVLLVFLATYPALAEQTQPRILQDHRGSVMALSFSPDRATLATCSRDATIKLWDLGTDKVKATLTGHESDVYCVSFSPDGNQLASCSGDKTIRIWNAKTLQPVRTLTGHSEVVRWVAFSPDGKTLASASGDRTIRLWDPATGEQKRILTGHDNIVKMVRFSQDGNTLASCSVDATVRAWNIQSGECTATFEGHTSSIEGVSISPDGLLYASSSNDNTARIWNARTGQQLNMLLGHVGEVDSVAFAADRKTLITGCRDKLIRFWDVRSGLLLATLAGHTGRIESLEVSDDGKILATGGGGGDTSVRLWNIPELDDRRRDQAATPEPIPADIRRTGDRPIERQVDQLWRLIGNDDGDDVGVALRGLVSLGDKAVAPLVTRLVTSGALARNRIDVLIGEVGNADPDIRERAACDLIQAGEIVVDAVRTTLAKSPPPVAQHRLEMVLRDITTREPSAAISTAQLLRAQNGVRALKEIATPTAMQQLQNLARQDDNSELTHQAKAALAK
jgi:hypothetical protein